MNYVRFYLKATIIAFNKYFNFKYGHEFIRTCRVSVTDNDVFVLLHLR